MAKDFIYFDTDYIQSYVAQIQKGLMLRRATEEGNTLETESQIYGSRKTTKTSGGGSLLGMISLGHENESISKYEDLISKVAQTGLRVMEYELHDYIYEIFYNHIKENNLLI